MHESPLRLIKRYIEFEPREKVRRIAKDLRGIYVLYAAAKASANYDVLYIGLARTGARVRLKAHLKKPDWTHFSIFEVWNNVRDTELEELEGLFRHVYRKDAVANRLNVQKAYGKLRTLKAKTLLNSNLSAEAKTLAAWTIEIKTTAQRTLTGVAYPYTAWSNLTTRGLQILRADQVNRAAIRCT